MQVVSLYAARCSSRCSIIFIRCKCMSICKVGCKDFLSSKEIFGFVQKLVGQLNKFFSVSLMHVVWSVWETFQLAIGYLFLTVQWLGQFNQGILRANRIRLQYFVLPSKLTLLPWRMRTGHRIVFISFIKRSLTPKRISFISGCESVKALILPAKSRQKLTWQSHNFCMSSP